MLKFKITICMFCSAFALERRRIRDDEYPLISRVMLGPHEDVARVFIVDAQQTDEISPQVGAEGMTKLGQDSNIFCLQFRVFLFFLFHHNHFDFFAA